MQFENTKTAETTISVCRAHIFCVSFFRCVSLKIRQNSELHQASRNISKVCGCIEQ